MDSDSDDNDYQLDFSIKHTFKKPYNPGFDIFLDYHLTRQNELHLCSYFKNIPTDVTHIIMRYMNLQSIRCYMERDILPMIWPPVDEFLAQYKLAWWEYTEESIAE